MMWNPLGLTSHAQSSYVYVGGGGQGAKISRNMNPANFDKQLRETDAAITSVTSNLAVSLVTDSISDIADNTTKKVEYLYSNRKGTEVEKVTGPAVGLTPLIG